MADKVQKNQIADLLLDFYDEYDSNVINRPMIPNIYAGKIIDSLQEEPYVMGKTGKFTTTTKQHRKEKTMDKLAKVRAEVARIQLYTQSETLKQILSFIDSLEEEPVSEDLRDEEETMVYQGEVYTRVYKDELDKFANKFVKSVPKPSRKYARYSDVDMVIAVKEGAKWQKEKDESTTEDLGEYINELSKQFPEVSFAKLSRIAVRVSRWQRNQDVKNKLPKVISRTDLNECAYDMSTDWMIDNQW